MAGSVWGIWGRPSSFWSNNYMINLDECLLIPVIGWEWRDVG